MTQEEKQLLLKDLCARSLYGVKCQYNCIVPGVMEISNAVGELQGIVPFDNTIGFMIDFHKVNALYDNIRPYLRPMSSMTEEEFKEYHSMLISIDNSGLMNQGLITKIVDWLDEKMFDHRNLIPKGLALEAKKGMYLKQQI